MELLIGPGLGLGMVQGLGSLIEWLVQGGQG